MNYFIVFSALVTASLSLIFPWEMTKALCISIISNFPFVGKDVQNFIFNEYMPELEKSVKEINIPLKTKTKMFNQWISILMKSIYAFIFQEQFFPVPMLYHWIPMEIAAHFMPVWNKVANWLSEFKQTDSDFNHAINVYPGDSWCRVYSPHALWHEESSGLLFDFALTSNYINGIFQN